MLHKTNLHDSNLEEKNSIENKKTLDLSKLKNKKDMLQKKLDIIVRAYTTISKKINHNKEITLQLADIGFRYGLSKSLAKSGSFISRDIYNQHRLYVQAITDAEFTASNEEEIKKLTLLSKEYITTELELSEVNKELAISDSKCNQSQPSVENVPKPLSDEDMALDFFVLQSQKSSSKSSVAAISLFSPSQAQQKRKTGNDNNQSSPGKKRRIDIELPSVLLSRTTGDKLAQMVQNSLDDAWPPKKKI